MINILPIEDRKELKRDYFKRLFTVALVFFACTMLMAIIMLLPTIIFLNEHEGIHQRELEYINKKLSDVGISQMMPMVDDINKKVKILRAANAFGKYSDTMTEIISSGGTGVSITSFSIKEDGNVENIYISGNSATRKDLLAFIENLKKCRAGLKTKCIPFDKVESPVSNLLKENDIDFSITAQVIGSTTKK